MKYEVKFVRTRVKIQCHGQNTHQIPCDNKITLEGAHDDIMEMIETTHHRKFCPKCHEYEKWYKYVGYDPDSGKIICIFSSVQL